MGIAEVLPRLPNLLRRIAETAEAVVAMRPDALVTIDSPDFSLRVARAARKRLPELQDDPLCRAVGLGLAAGAGGEDGRGHRPRAGAAAVRAALHGGRRDDLRLRRPPGGRGAAAPTPRRWRRCAPSSPSARAAGAGAAAGIAPGRGDPARAGVRRGGAAAAGAASRPGGDRPGGAGGGRPARRAAAARRRGLAARARSARLRRPRPGRRASARPSPRPTWRWPPRARSASSWRRRGRRW